MVELKHGNTERKEEGRRLGERTRREKSCHVDLVLWPSADGGWVGGVSKKTGSEEGGHRFADILVHEQRTTQALCVYTRCVRSPARVEEGLKWRYYRQHGGGTPKFKEGALSRPRCANVCLQKRRTTHITSLCLLIALCCFAFLPLPVFVRFQRVSEPNPCPLRCSVYISTLKGSLVNTY